MADNKLQAKKPATMAEYVDDLNKKVMNELEKRKNAGYIIPKNYAPQNALTTALYKIQEEVKDKNQKPALSVCTPESVKQALIGMLTKGLDPAKTQCYFIVYGNKLTMTESYFGLVHRAKEADPNIDRITAQIVYAKDEFDFGYENGEMVILKHKPSPDNIDLKNIKGAYATIIYKDGKTISDYMTWKQITDAWSKSQTKGNSDTHEKFADQMAKRTVLKRLVKSVVNTANDSQLVADIDEIDEEQEALEATETIDITPPDEETEDYYEEEPDEEPEPPKKAPAKKQPEPDDFDDLPDILKG